MDLRHLVETSLSIVQALGPRREQLAKGHWLIGALQFSADQPEAALTSFDLAEKAGRKLSGRLHEPRLSIHRPPLFEEGSKPAQFVQQLRAAALL